MPHRVLVLVLTLIGTTLVGSSAFATVVVVPDAFTFAPNIFASNCIPFGQCNDHVRYQQWYSRDQFSAFSGPEIITQIGFRADKRLTAPVSLTFQNVIVKLSTTTVSFGAAFDANVGADVATVFSGILTLSSSDMSIIPPFDFVISLQTPFQYDPSAGDLLLEFQNHAIDDTLLQFFLFDAVSGSSVAHRLFAPSPPGACRHLGVWLRIGHAVHQRGYRSGPGTGDLILDADRAGRVEPA